MTVLALFLAALAAMGGAAIIDEAVVYRGRAWMFQLIVGLAVLAVGVLALLSIVLVAVWS